MRWGAWLVSSLVLGPLLLLVVNGTTRRWSQPAWSAWGLLSGVVAVAGATICAVATLAWTLFARVSVIARVGEWSTSRVERATRIPLGVSIAATAAGVLVLANLIRVVTSQHAVNRETRAALVGAEADDDVTIIADDLPYAHALSGWRAENRRILVSTGMITALTRTELASVLAHERSHLRHHHGWFRMAGELAAAVNPLLRWSTKDLGFALERWADEEAAAATGRGQVAVALQRAALTRLERQPVGVATPIGFGAHGVPRRIAALLSDPGGGRWIGSALYVVVFVLVSGGVVRALERSEDLVEALQNLH